MVVNQFAGDAGDGLLACRIDIYQDDFVQQGKAVGEIFVEITGTCVEVRLENSRQLLVPIEGTHGEYALLYLGRMVRIVAQETTLSFFILKSKRRSTPRKLAIPLFISSSVNPLICAKAMAATRSQC